MVLLLFHWFFWLWNSSCSCLARLLCERVRRSERFALRVASNTRRWMLQHWAPSHNSILFYYFFVWCAVSILYSLMNFIECKLDNWFRFVHFKVFDGTAASKTHKIFWLDSWVLRYTQPYTHVRTHAYQRTHSYHYFESKIHVYRTLSLFHMHAHSFTRSNISRSLCS